MHANVIGPGLPTGDGQNNDAWYYYPTFGDPNDPNVAGFQRVIDNRDVDFASGSSLLAAARKLGLDIPVLCYQPGCTPNTACMACVVKVRDPDRILPSCATPADDGLVVESETPELHALRRTALELLLSDHSGAEADPDHPGRLRCDCTKRDVCRLRKYAELYQADPARYRGVQRHVERHYEHPEIRYDPTKCILCGICIQIARQFREPLGLTWVGRGFDVRVDVALAAPFADALRTAARRCAAACPTAALTLRKTGDVPVETRREED